MADTDTETETETPVPSLPARRNVLGVRLTSNDLYIVAVTPPGKTIGHRRYDQQLAYWSAQNEGVRPDKLEDVALYASVVNLLPGKVLVPEETGYAQYTRDATVAELAEINGTDPAARLAPKVKRPLSSIIHIESRNHDDWQTFSNRAVASQTYYPTWAVHHKDLQCKYLGLHESKPWLYIPPGLPRSLSIEQKAAAFFEGSIEVWLPRQIWITDNMDPSNLRDSNGHRRAEAVNFTGEFPLGGIKFRGTQFGLPRIRFCVGQWMIEE